MTIKMIFKCNLGPTAPQVTGHETKKNFKTNFGAGDGGEASRRGSGKAEEIGGSVGHKVKERWRRGERPNE